MLNQQFQEPFLAVVVDPVRTMASGKVEIGAFRWAAARVAFAVIPGRAVDVLNCSQRSQQPGDKTGHLIAGSAKPPCNQPTHPPTNQPTSQTNQPPTHHQDVP